MTRIRPTAIIMRDNKILVMKRIRNDFEYFVFPGGHIEKYEGISEKEEETLVREVKEELNFDIKDFQEIHRITKFSPRDNREVESIFYLINNFSGELKLGGPEVQRMKHGNFYYPTWYSKDEFEKLDPVYPDGIKEYILTNLKF